MADDNPFDVYFVALYIIYAVGNAFLPVFTGGMRDCNGDRIVLGSLAIIMMVGQVLFCWGVNEKWVLMMILGRVFLGWGVESTLPILVSYLAPYFRSHIVPYIVTIVHSVVPAIIVPTNWTSLLHLCDPHHTSRIHTQHSIALWSSLYICRIDPIVGFIPH